MDEYITVYASESGERIDALLAHSVEGLSRSAAQRLIESASVLLDGVPVRKNYRCKGDECFDVYIPEPDAAEPLPQEIPLDVVYEDDDVIVVNKARGMVVHPAPGHPDGTLVNALMYRCGDSLSGIGGEKRPGIVHRIDKDTSGLIIAAKNDFSHLALSAQLSGHSLYREYLAVIRGGMREDSGTVDAPIGRHRTDRKRMAVTQTNSRPAVTHWSVVERYRGYTLIKCVLETGRTHQIRVHMAYIGHPLLGDGLYGAPCPDKGLEGQCLHASALHFKHPRSDEDIVLNAPLPEYFQTVLSKLGNPVE
ncbi:MAG: RluA family pseudouridine synthase [Oscillospiraceae bacterium]|nr:RluA family pseudouridine synthase [Oscillospiraceae bacterium]